MTVRDWVVEKLRSDPGYDIGLEGEHGFVVDRGIRPKARVYCPDASDTNPFTADDLDQALEEMPELRFIVVVRRHVANEVYTLADQESVAVGGLRALKSALAEDFNVGKYRSNEQAYVQGRLEGNAQVQSWLRRGESAYEITRNGDRETITIVTIQPYELTSDEVYALLAQHDGIEVDAIVTTNPSCHGFAPTTLDAVGDAGTQIMTLRDFLDSLRDPWA